MNTIRNQTHIHSYLAQQAELTTEQRRQRHSAIIFAVCLAVVMAIMVSAFVQQVAA